VAAGHQPRPRDLEKHNQRCATGDVRWQPHGAPIMGNLANCRLYGGAHNGVKSR
jgi:hypothetical protein